MLLGFGDAESTSLEQDLATWGAHTGRAASVEAAVARMAEAQSLGHRYHLVLVREDRQAESERILARLRNSRGQKIAPAVLCTRGPSETRRAEALASGFSAVLEVPFEKRLLFNAVHSATAIQGGQEGVISLSDYYAARDADRHRYQILVAEDNAVNQRVIVGILERAVGDGEQALDALENERFDLVIMDLNMPELGGLDAARAYRFIDPESVRVPIIILSADVTAEAMEECEEAGIDAFLPKPVEARRLLDTIARLIAERSSALAELSGDGNAAPMVVNPAVLAELELISTGVTFMPDLINGFVKDGEALLRQMEAAVAEGQHDILRDLVHAMKGSAVTLGVEQLSRACGAIVNQPPTEQEAGGQRALRLVREQFQQARVALLEYLKKSQSAAR
jgi:two-component system sensor histidine kinase RpfC